MCFCFFRPVLPFVSTPYQLFSRFSPELYLFFFFFIQALSLSDLTHLRLIFHFPRHCGRKQGGRGNSHYLWEHTLTSAGFIPTAFKPLQPPSGWLSVTRFVGSRNSPCSRMTPITSHLLHNLFFFQASGSKWMVFFVFGNVFILGCLVFYWHELLETQGWLNMTFFFILVGVVGTCHAQPVQYLWPFLWVYWRAWSHLSALKENSDLSLSISCAYVNTHNRTQILLKSMLWFTLIVHCEHKALQVHFAFCHCMLALYVCH